MYAKDNFSLFLLEIHYALHIVRTIREPLHLFNLLYVHLTLSKTINHAISLSKSYNRLYILSFRINNRKSVRHIRDVTWNS